MSKYKSILNYISMVEISEMAALDPGVEFVRINLHVDWVITRSCDVIFSSGVSFLCCCTVRSQAGRDVMRELSNDNDDAVAEKRQRGPGVQRLRPVL